MRRLAPLLTLLLAALACQVVPTPPPLKSTPRFWLTPSPSSAPLPAAPTASPAAQTRPTGSPGDLPPFPVFPPDTFAAGVPQGWQASGAATLGPALPADLSAAANLAVAAGLTERQRQALARQGFTAVQGQEASFADIRERVALRYGQPYYLTTDAAYHALHLALDETLAALEREELLRRMTILTQAALTQTLSYAPQVQGKELEQAVRLSAAYLGVALRLFDPQTALPPELEPLVAPQVAQILAARGLETSTLFPGFQDDFSAYRPTGHYAGDPALEAYFRGMTWLGRVNFALDQPVPDAPETRLPLVLTLALRQAQVAPGISAAQEWAQVNAALDFLTGPRDDSGPPEYAALMDRAYGPGVTVIGLADPSRWQLFQAFAGELPPPQIGSPLLVSLQELETGQGWRFMGQRRSLDGYILQNLLYDRVGAPEKPRLLPSGLDLAAALGSPAAEAALQKAGETAYARYPEQLAALQAKVQAEPETAWLASVYTRWLHAFQAQLPQRDARYPAYMRTPAWTYKDLNTVLGSWAELKHATALYGKLPESVAGGGPPASGPAPAWVEPDPLVFYRLAHTATAAASGLQSLGYQGVFDADPQQPGLGRLLTGLLDLGDRLNRLGDIAAAELAGKSPSESDRELILAPLGPAEQRAEQERLAAAGRPTAPLPLPPAPVIAAVAGGGERILQAGVGQIDRLYVLVPIDGQLQIAQGGIFSYYEFPQPRSGRLTDAEWRHLLVVEPPARPAWSAELYLPDGSPVDVLAFRPGDVYRVTLAGGRLNLRQAPDRNSAAVHQLQAGDYVTITGGPQQADGFTWWQLRLEPPGSPPIEGWAVEDPAWFERAYGQ